MGQSYGMLAAMSRAGAATRLRGENRSTRVRAKGAVASPHHAATRAGCDVLATGGNAADAAIAVNAVLSVVYPHMCGIGGDAFVLYYEARTGRVHCLNGTGPAPENATRETLRERGYESVPVRGPLSVTVPGAVASWDAMLARFGTRPLSDLLGPAIVTAETGFELGRRLSGWMENSREALRSDPALARTFFDQAGEPLRSGARVRQPELARTLGRIAKRGSRDFYVGETAERLDTAMRDAGGLMTARDLRRYAPTWVAPIESHHGGLTVVTTPPNSQGITGLLMLDRIAAAGAGVDLSADYVRAFVGAKRAAFEVRDRYVTDPDYMQLPAERLLEGSFEPGRPASAPPIGGDTCYFCTADSEGNACSMIQSIFYSFGSAFVAGDTGVLLHNRGHHFSLDEDHPNRLEPGKRTMHTLMACMALENGRPRFVFGTMGADGQPQFNVQVLHRLLGGGDPQAAVSAPRVLHGRFLVEDDPDVLHVESDLDPRILSELEATVPNVNVVPAKDERLGHAHALRIEPDGSMSAGSDPRSDGSAEVLA
jgi:gamma-glutamyltranspeptidase